MKKQISCSVLLLSMLFSTLVGCGDTKAPAGADDTTAPSSSDPNVTTEITRENYPDSLPDNLDFEGRKITILSRSGDSMLEDEIAVEEEIGETVNDAIYNRNRKVEERLKVEIIEVEKPAFWSDRNAFMNTVTTSVMAEDHEFDVVSGYAYYIPQLSIEGYLTNLTEVDHLDFSQPWWPKGLMDQLAINDKLYYISGDIALTFTSKMYAMLFNQELIELYGLSKEELYKDVFDGKWTLDKLMEYSEKFSADLDNNSVYDENDQSGFMQRQDPDLYFSAFDLPIVSNKDGKVELAMYNEKLVNAYNKLFNFFKSTTVAPQTTTADFPHDLFMNNQVAFYQGTINDASMLRDMTSDFGIIPLPKYDENQAEYRTVPHDSYALLSIVKTCENVDEIGAFLEALAAESYRMVTPAYFDDALKNKYSRDEDSRKILDMLKDGVSFDFGSVYSYCLNNPAHFLRAIREGNDNPASHYDSKKSAYETKLTELLEIFKTLD